MRPLRELPRTSVTLSRVAQGVSSFAFAAAGTNGFVTAVITFAVTAVVCTVGAVMAGEGRRILGSFRLPQLWSVTVVGFLAIYLAAQAYHLAAVAPVSFLLLLVPLFATLMAPFAGERLTRNGMIGLAISMVGIALFAKPEQGSNPQWPGLACALAAGGALAWLWYLSRDLAAHDDDLWALSAAQNYVPAVLGLAAVLLLGDFPGGVSLAWLLVSGLGYAGNVILRLFGFRRLPASTASLIAPVSAIVSTLLAVVILHEVPDGRTWLGAAVITVGVIVATRQSGGVRPGTRQPGGVRPGPERSVVSQDGQDGWGSDE